MNNSTHWTEQSSENYLYSVATDFVEQLREKMDAIGMKPAKLAKVAKVSKGRISQIFKDPGNISLETMIKFARALGLHLSVVAYEKADDPDNERGPVNSDIFRILWEKADRPFDMWDVQALPQMTITIDLTKALPPHLCGFDKYPGGYAELGANMQVQTREKTVEVRTKAGGKVPKLKEFHNLAS